MLFLVLRSNSFSKYVVGKLINNQTYSILRFFPFNSLFTAKYWFNEVMKFKLKLQVNDIKNIKLYYNL